MKHILILTFVLFCGMNCNNRDEQPVAYSQVVDFERFDTEKGKTESCLLELELLNLRLERHLKQKTLSPKTGVVHPITNIIDY